MKTPLIPKVSGCFSLLLRLSGSVKVLQTIPALVGGILWFLTEGIHIRDDCLQDLLAQQLGFRSFFVKKSVNSFHNQYEIISSGN